MNCRVLFINTPRYIGGAEISLLQLMHRLLVEGVELRLLTSGAGPFEQRARELGISTLCQEFPWFSRRRPWCYGASVYRLARLVRRDHLQIIHTKCDHSLKYVQLATRLVRVPFVSHVRDFSRTWFQPRQVAVLNGAARVIANSKATAEACVGAGVDPDRVTVIYNPIDVGTLRHVSVEAAAQERRVLGIPSNALIFGIVGQVQPMKGHAEFMSAALQVAERIPKAHFLVVGAAPPDDEARRFACDLERQARSSKWSDRFHFVGFRADIGPLMRTIDILTVPSWNEPFGRVAVEGMAAGCAIVGTRAGGLPEIITDQVDGLLVPPRDASALAAAWLNLYLQPALRTRLCERGAFTAERFGVERHVQAVKGVYEAVLASRPRAL